MAITLQCDPRRVLWLIRVQDILDAAAELGVTLTQEQLDELERRVSRIDYSRINDEIVREVEGVTGIKPCPDCGLYVGSSTVPCECGQERMKPCQ